MVVVVERALKVEEGLKYIEAAGAHKQGVVAWDIFNNHFVKSPLEIKNVARYSKIVTFFAPFDSRANFDFLINGSGKINFFLSESAMGFSAELLMYRSNGLIEVNHPDNFLLFERRDFERQLLDGDVMVSMPYKGLTINKRCLDISAGGFSIVFSKNEAAQCKLEGKIKIKLLLAKKELDIEVMVVENQKLLPFVSPEIPYGGVRYSLKFVTSDPTLGEFIMKYIQVLNQIKDPPR